MASNPALLVQVRAALASDLDRILEIECAAPTAAHWSRADYQSALTATSPCRFLGVAEVKAEVEGFLVARSLLIAEWEIENVVVADAGRRMGFGSALVSSLL